MLGSLVLGNAMLGLHNARLASNTQLFNIAGRKFRPDRRRLTVRLEALMFTNCKKHL